MQEQQGGLKDIHFTSKRNKWAERFKPQERPKIRTEYTEQARATRRPEVDI
jgi:hypothetical protein